MLDSLRSEYSAGATATVVFAALVCESAGWRTPVGQHHEGLDYEQVMQVLSEALESHTGELSTYGRKGFVGLMRT